MLTETVYYNDQGDNDTKLHSPRLNSSWKSWKGNAQPSRARERKSETSKKALKLFIVNSPSACLTDKVKQFTLDNVSIIMIRAIHIVILL